MAERASSSGPERVFSEPWHAHVFALTVKLSELGHFSWTEWSEHFGARLRDAAAQDGSAHDHRPMPEVDSPTYYNVWLDALESLLIQRRLARPEDLAHLKESWTAAYLETPHGQPVVLRNNHDLPQTEDHHHIEFDASAGSWPAPAAKSVLISGMQEPQLVPARRIAPISAGVVSFPAPIASRIAASPTAEAGTDDLAARVRAHRHQGPQAARGAPPARWTSEQAGRAIRLRERRTWRGEEHASLQPASDQTGIAENGLVGIGIGDELRGVRDLKQLPQNVARMDDPGERRPAGQLIGEAGRDRGLGTSRCHRRYPVCRRLDATAARTRFLPRLRSDPGSLEVRLTGNRIGQRMHDAGRLDLQTRTGRSSAWAGTPRRRAWQHRPSRATRHEPCWLSIRTSPPSDDAVPARHRGD